MTRILRTLLVLLLAGVPVFASAGEAIPTELDPVAAARAVKLAEKLRCLVCQNESIAESRADLANDLRREIRVQITAGRSDEEIVEFMVSRYGDFVLYDPPLKATTALLWAGPALLLLAGILVLGYNLRRIPTAEPPITAQEQNRAARLLAAHTEERV